MEESYLKKGNTIRNIKYGMVAEVQDLCKMKMESGEWVDGVIYWEKDRFTGEMTRFCKRKSDVLNEFVEYKSWTTWIGEVLDQLSCNMSDEKKKENPLGSFRFTQKNIIKSIEFFEDCYRDGLSAYKALTLFEPDE